MTAYIVKLLVMLPLVIGLIVASLWAWKHFQPGMAAMPSLPALSSFKGLASLSAFAPLRRKRALTLVDAISFGMAGRVAVVEFGGQHLLVGIGRNGMALLSQTPAPVFALPADAEEAADDA